MERRKHEQIQRKQGWYVIPQYKKARSTYVPNLSVISHTVPENSLTQNSMCSIMERKKRINKVKNRMDEGGIQPRNKTTHPLPIYQTSFSISYSC